MSDIEERVKKIVVEHLGVEEAKIQSDSKFIDDLGADSLDTQWNSLWHLRKNLVVKYQTTQQKKL